MKENEERAGWRKNGFVAMLLKQYGWIRCKLQMTEEANQLMRRLSQLVQVVVAGE